MISFCFNFWLLTYLTLRLQIAQSRYYLQTLDAPKWVLFVYLESEGKELLNLRLLLGSQVQCLNWHEGFRLRA